jgi:hypothetical protein
MKSLSVFVGQSSSLVQSHTDSLCDRFQFPKTSSLNIQEDFGISVCRDNSVRLCKCSHLLYSLDFCSQCKRNSECIYQSSRKLFESEDYSSVLNICYDFNDPFSVWCYDRLIKFADSEVKSPVTGSILLDNQLNGINGGINNYLSLYSGSKALSFSTFLILRGMEEYLIQNNENTNKSDKIPLSTSDCCRMIACDLSFNFFPHNGLFYSTNAVSSYVNFPYHVCSFSNKIIDLRSSLFRTLTKMDYQKRKGIQSVDIHPLRLLSSNLHTLHLRYQNQFPQHFLALQTSSSMSSTSSSSSFLDCQRDLCGSFCNIRLNPFSNDIFPEAKFIPSRYSSIEVQNSMNWATNSFLKWDLLEGNELLSTSSSDLKPNVTNNAKLLDISVFAFQSYYGLLELKELCQKVKSSLEKGTYKHLLHNSLLGEDEMVDKVIDLHIYLQNKI